MKTIFKTLIFFILILFVSCASLQVPGEKNQVKENLYAEYYTLATNYEELKKYTKAIEYYLLASKSKTIKENCEYKIARCYALNKDWNNAETAYMSLLKKDSKNLNLKLSLAYIYAMKGSLDMAVNLYKELYQESPLDLSVLKNYTNVLIALKNKEEAEKVFEVLKNNYPDEACIENLSKAIEALNKENQSPEEAEAR